MINVLAFVGRRYSGKSTAAEMVSKIDHRFMNCSFADILRHEYAEHSRIPYEKLADPKYKDEYRQALFSYADEKKSKDPFYFASTLLSYFSDGDHLVIDDMRFMEELQVVLKHNAAIYRIHADAHIRRDRGWRRSHLVDENYSETELGDVSGYTLWTVTSGKGGVIYNNRDDQLYEQIRKIVRLHFPPLNITVSDDDSCPAQET